MRRMPTFSASPEQESPSCQASRSVLLALLVLAAAACDGRDPDGQHDSLQRLAQSLVGEAGAGGDGADEQESPALLLSESKLSTSGMTDWSKFGSALAVSG